MNLGGIIAGALGGAGGAAVDIGNNMLTSRARDEEFARQQAARQQDRQWRREDALWEMEQKLRMMPAEAQAKANAELEADRVKGKAFTTAREGIIGSRLDAEFASPEIGNESTLTPEQRAVIDRGLAEQKTAKDKRANELRTDREVITETGLTTGQMSPKEAATIANNADIAQLRADVANAKNNAQREALQARLDNAIAIANIRADARGRGGDGTKEVLGFIEAQRKDLASELADLARAQRAEVEAAMTPKLKQQIIADYAERRRALEAKRDQLDADFKSVRGRLNLPGLSENAPPPKGKPGDNAGQRDPGKIAEPKSEADFKALPSGTKFRAPDGSVRIKP